MKQTIIHLIVLIALCVLHTSCKEQLEEIEGGKIDRTKMAEVTLTEVRITNEEVATRASLNSSPMSVGYKFRLYAFERGVTDINELITTRTYTIKGQAGVPVSDIATPLYLPVGDLDIYLVGPLQEVFETVTIDKEGNRQVETRTVDIATESGVYPEYGVDLISSKTELKVEMGANQFQAQPLSHRMAQVRVAVERPADANYENLNVNTIFLSNQTIQGEFAFDQNGGSVIPTNEGPISFYPVIKEESIATRFTSTLYLLPRNVTHMRIGVYFTCNLKNTPDKLDRRLESGVINDVALPAGKITTFTTRPTVSTKLQFRVRVLPWTDEAIPDITLPYGDHLQFSYSGLDAPIVKDGKKYWIDRSGNGRDAELIGDIRYNQEEMYYYAVAEGSYIKIPDIGSLPIYTLEVTAESANNKLAIPILFGDAGIPHLTVKLPVSGNKISFKCGGGVSEPDICPNDKGYLENLAVYAFARNNQQMSISRNGARIGTDVNVTGSPAPGPFTDNRMLYWNEQIGNNSMSHLKIYAVRMSDQYLAPGTEELKQNYRNDMAMFAKSDVDPNYATSYIKNGLILDLRGGVGASGSEWKDQSGNDNHAQVFNATVSGNSYSFNGTNAYMKLLKTLGTLQEYTVEFIAQAENTRNVLFQFTSLQGINTNRDFLIHFPWDNGSVYIDSPYLNGRGENNQFIPLVTKFPYASISDKLYQYSIIRKSGHPSDGIQMKQCGITVPGTQIPTLTPLNEMKHCYIGQGGDGQMWFKGKLHTVRVYNRILSEKERQINYQVDKVKYNLLP